jgi:hypothetical protein
MRNIWSLPVGEVVAGDEIREYFRQRKLKDKYELFFPLNGQMNDFDLLLLNLKTGKTAKLQVKESRTFGKNDAWIIVDKDKVNNIVCDFYIFVIHTIVESDTKKKIETRYLIISSKQLKEKSKTKKGYHLQKKKLQYHYYFKIRDKEAWEDRDNKKQKIDYSEFLDNFRLLEI